MAQLETWKDIPGYEGYYQVSDLGNVRSLDRVVKAGNGSFVKRGQLLKPAIRKSGHLQVRLYRNGSRCVEVHTLVGSAFIGPRPVGYEVCHNNGIPSDNRLHNIRYGTQSENTRDMVKHGAHLHARKTHCKHGHPLSGNNLYIPPGRPKRVCKTCVKLRARKVRGYTDG